MKILKRIYSFSDPVLSFVSSRILSAAKRDLNQLADQGVTQEELDEIGLVKKDFDDHETDVELMYDVALATQNRDKAGKLLLQIINQVVSKALFKFGATDSRYTTYGVGDISHDIPLKKLLKARRVLLVAKEQQPELLAQGMSDELLLKLSNQIDLYNTCIMNHYNAVIARKDSMQKRTELGNELYRLIKTLADKGKLCWMNSNESNHNDYILYHRHPKGSQTIESKIEAESGVSHELAGVKPSTAITITNNGLTELTVFFANDPLDITGEPFSKILPGAKKIIPASGIGYDKAKEKTCFNVVNGGVVEGSYEVVWK